MSMKIVTQKCSHHLVQPHTESKDRWKEGQTFSCVWEGGGAGGARGGRGMAYRPYAAPGAAAAVCGARCCYPAPSGGLSAGSASVPSPLAAPSPVPACRATEERRRGEGRYIHAATVSQPLGYIHEHELMR